MTVLARVTTYHSPLHQPSEGAMVLGMSLANFTLVVAQIHAHLAKHPAVAAGLAAAPH